MRKALVVNGRACFPDGHKVSRGVEYLMFSESQEAEFSPMCGLCMSQLLLSWPAPARAMLACA